MPNEYARTLNLRDKLPCAPTYDEVMHWCAVLSNESAARQFKRLYAKATRAKNNGHATPEQYASLIEEVAALKTC